VDEALDSMGDEYADVPRPGGCCEKDAQKAREAARILKVVSAADPTAKAAALRAATDPMSPFTQEQLANALDEMEESDLDSNDLLTDSDDDELGTDKRMEDPALREIREKRMRELRAQAQKQQELAQKATYGGGKETDIPKIVAEGPSRVVFHFVLEGSDESARVDEVLDQLAPAFSRTRFVRIRPNMPSPYARHARCDRTSRDDLLQEEEAREMDARIGRLWRRRRFRRGVCLPVAREGGGHVARASARAPRAGTRRCPGEQQHVLQR
jgi:hypothetical protein